MYKDFYNNKLVPFVNKVRMACNVGEIPLVFDNSLTYYEQIAAFSAKLNDVISTVNVQSLTLCEFMQQLTEAFKELSDDFATQWADIQAAFVQLRGRVNVLDERVTALENLPLGVGLQIPEGTQYEYEGETYTAGTNCEIFGCYETQDSNTKNEAAGNYSHAEGVGTKAYFSESHAEGIETVTLARASHAEGIGSQTHAQASHAEGSYTTTSEFAAHAEGESSTASGRASHAEGYTTAASGNYSHAEGYETTAVGNYSHAEGYKTTAVGMYTHAEGMSNSAVGNYSHAEGNGNNAVGTYAHAEGQNNIAQGEYSHIEGYGNNITSVATGAHVEGQGNTATAINSHAEGYGCYANGNASHCEGYNNHANGIRSHCEGYNSEADGDASHAEGTQCIASAQNAHAGGDSCTASGTCSFVHGTNSTASGGNAGAVGNNLIASGNNQFVCGYNNAEKNSDYLFIVGNGAASRSNAFEVDKYGNIYSNGSAKPLNELTDENRAELIELVNVPGKNKLSFSEIGTNNSHGVTFSSNGVDWTLNADGTITATRTSTSAADSSCNLRIDTGSIYIDDFCNGSFVLSGCPEGGGENTFSLRALRGEDYRETDTGSGVILPDREASSNIYINILYSKDYTGEITFRPMICSKTAFIISPAWIGPETPETSGGVTVYENSNYTITPYSDTNPHVDNLSATADGYLIGSLQTVHISGSYDIYYSVSSDTGYKICDITVPGTITDPEKEIAITTNFDTYLASGSIYNFYVAKIETIDSVKKLAIYFKSMGRSHGSSGLSFTFDITATFSVSQ